MKTKRCPYDAVGKGFLGVLVILAVFAGFLVLTGECRADRPLPILKCQRIAQKMRCELKHCFPDKPQWVIYKKEGEVIASQRGCLTYWKRGKHITEEWRTLAVQGKQEFARTNTHVYHRNYLYEVDVVWRAGKIFFRPHKGLKLLEEE